MRMGALWIVLIVLMFIFVHKPGLCAAGTPARLYVSPQGNDAWSGRLSTPNAARTDGPFATLERARDEIRKLKKASQLPKGAIVELCAGVYERTRPLKLSKQDAGTENAPIVYRSMKGAGAVLSGGKVVANWKPVTDRNILDRLDLSARKHVVQADLKALGIAEYGSPAGGGLMLYFNGKPMQIARWPNKGFVRIAGVVEPGTVNVRGTKGSRTGKFFYEGDRPERWAGEKDIWLHGYWFWDWSDQRQQVESIDTGKRIITLKPPYHRYGYRKGQWYYAYNLLCEIDEPGEWYLDRETGILYFWPPSPVEKGQAIVSVTPTIVEMQNVSYVRLEGLAIEAARGTAIIVKGGKAVRIDGCTIRNCGASAVNMSGCVASGVANCEIYNMGGGGVALSGGDRKSLTPAGLYADNNHIHDYGQWRRMYQCAVGLYGVGNRATHNVIHDAPHQAIAFSGNDHLMEFNEIYRVCLESNDAGAIYAGRNWTMRGTVIRYNYLHDINGFRGRGCVGVYLDDMFCGTTIFGNVFYKVTRAAFIGGGRDCLVENNIFVDCRRALHIDARALGWAHYHADMWIKEAKTKGTLQGIRYKEPPYSTRYPRLVTIIENNPKAPIGNVVRRNIFFHCKPWDDVNGAAKPFVKLEDNLIDKDPHFVDLAHKNFQLCDDSPAYALGFKKIPVEKIGLRKNGR